MGAARLPADGRHASSCMYGGGRESFQNFCYSMVEEKHSLSALYSENSQFGLIGKRHAFALFEMMGQAAILHSWRQLKLAGFMLDLASCLTLYAMKIRQD